MCQHHIWLAELGDTRFITQCEHGTIHTMWDHLSLHLVPNDFRMVNQTLQSMATTMNGSCEASRSGCVRIIIERVGLEFEPVDFLHLACLAASAAHKLNQPPSTLRQPGAHPRNEEFCELRHVYPGRHSLN